MKRVVAWFNWEEWARVYEDLYSEDPVLRKHGVDRITVWKCRVLHRLSTAIECTSELVRAQLLDRQYENNVDKQMEVRLTMSMAVTRFINLITEKSQSRGYAQPVHQLAEELGIPDWMVDLRHDATHSGLPSLVTLRKAVSVSLDWLKYNYWETKYETEQQEAEEGPSKSKYPNTTKPVCPLDSQVAEEKLHSLFKQYMELYFQGMAKSENKTVTEDLEKLARSNKKEVLEVFVSGTALLSTKQLKSLNIRVKELLHKKDVSLPDDLKDLWRPLLKLFHHHHLTSPLLHALTLALRDENLVKHKLISGWINLILTNLRDPKVKGMYKLSCDHNVPQLVDEILKHPSVYTTSLVQSIFSKQECGFSASQKDKLLNAMQQFSSAVTEPEHLDSLWTLEQISTGVCSDNRKYDTPSSSCQDSEEVVYKPASVWRLCTDVYDWHQYPIGTCPGVSINYTNLELSPHPRPKSQHSPTDNTEIHTKAENTGETSLEAADMELMITESKTGQENSDCKDGKFESDQQTTVSPTLKWSALEIQKIADNIVLF